MRFSNRLDILDLRVALDIVMSDALQYAAHKKVLGLSYDNEEHIKCIQDAFADARTSVFVAPYRAKHFCSFDRRTDCESCRRLAHCEYGKNHVRQEETIVKLEKELDDIKFENRIIVNSIEIEDEH